MAYKITQPANQSTIVVQIRNPLDPQLDPLHIMQDIGKLIGNITGTFYVIYDLRELTVTFPDIVKGLVGGFRSNIPELSILRERGKMIFVGAGHLVELMAKSGQRLQPDQSTIKVFATVEEALAHAREQLAKGT